jgi:hypothetical protein
MAKKVTTEEEGKESGKDWGTIAGIYENLFCTGVYHPS